MPTVNHENLVRARQQAQLSLADAARKLQLRDSSGASAVQKLEAYESGVKDPSRPMLSKMASTYRKPILTFYLSNTPSTPDRGEDFRTLSNQSHHSDNFYIDTLIRDIRTSQSLLRETLEEEDEAETLTFIGRNSIENGITTVVDTVKSAINFDLKEYRKQSDLDGAFRYLRKLVENAGVYVVLKGNLGSFHTDIAVEAFRGFALSDNVAPFIVINDKDAKSAWSFTLLHEFTHLVLGQTGISGGNPDIQVEKFCNDVASEIILPAQDLEKIEASTEDLSALKFIISDYARLLNVSASHLAYRLHKRGDYPLQTWLKLSDYYREQWIQERDRKKRKNRESSSGPSYYVLRRHSLGTALIDVVQRLTQSGALSTTKAGTLLGVRPLKVHKLFTENTLTGSN